MHNIRGIRIPILEKCYFNQDYHQKIIYFLIKNTFYGENSDFLIKKSYKKHIRIKVKQKNTLALLEGSVNYHKFILLVV